MKAYNTDNADNADSIFLNSESVSEVYPNYEEETFSSVVIEEKQEIIVAAQQQEPMSFLSFSLIAIMVMLGALYLRLGRILEVLGGGGDSSAVASKAAVPVHSAAGVKTIHPGLSDEQFVAIISAAAAHVLGSSVSVVKFKPLNTMDWTWAVQGRVSLHSHKV